MRPTTEDDLSTGPSHFRQIRRPVADRHCFVARFGQVARQWLSFFITASSGGRSGDQPKRQTKRFAFCFG